MAALLIVNQIITGILLRFYYVPTPAEAYNSVVFLRQQVLFGPFIRVIHYWSGISLLLIAFMNFHPFFAAFIIPLSIAGFLAWIPFIRYNKPSAGHWFISDKVIRSARATAIFAVVITLAGILFNAWILNFEILMPGIPAFISNGLIPLRKLCSASRSRSF